MSVQAPSKKKVVAVAITTVALTVGSFGVAHASQKSTKVSRTSISVVGNPNQAGKPDRSAELSALLSTLVAKGTITQAQADAVVAAAKSAEAARDALRPIKGDRDAKLTLIASTLGTDTKTVLTRMQAGESLATIAGAKKDALITALVADETKRIDAAVTAGALTAAQATALKANLVAHVTAEVESTRPLGGPRGEMKGDHGDRGGKGGMKGNRGPGRGKGGPMGGAPVIPAPTPTTSSN
jgi:polyhydroxyalkanoate synthesis regulator phasin